MDKKNKEESIFNKYMRIKNKEKGRTTQLKTQASQRIILLMTKGSQIDPLAKKEDPIEKKQLEYLQFQNSFAESPKIVQFAYWKGQLDELRKELYDVEISNNINKIRLLEPTMKKQIEMVETIMKELFVEINQERKIISKTPFKE